MSEVTFDLPDLGEGLEDAEIVRWLVSQGDQVSLNQPIVEADTAKALVEIPSPFEGTVLKIHAEEGQTVEVGAALVTFEISEGAAAKRKAVLVGYGVEAETSPKRRRRLRRGSPSGDDLPAGGKPLASPPVRSLAKELGVDLGGLAGTGPSGRIMREDVEAAASGKRSDAPDDFEAERVPVRGVRRLVAEKMTRSVSEIPHVTTFLTVDASEMLRFRNEITSEGTKVTPLVVVAGAFVKIIEDHPKLNATFDAAAGEILIRKRIHLGIATDTERGLIVPVVRDANRLDVPSLAAEITRLSRAAREGTASPEDLVGGTVTISNVGTFGAEFGTPIINYPETAILALGLIEDRPAAVDGEIVVRPQVILSLSFDHRPLDGAEAGRALRDLGALLQDAEALRLL